MMAFGWVHDNSVHNAAGYWQFCLEEQEDEDTVKYNKTPLLIRFQILFAILVGMMEYICITASV